MSFDWMNYQVPERVLERNATHRRDMHVQEVKDRARMMRRFGHDQEYVLHRCLGNFEWGQEIHGGEPITEDDVRRVVAEVFGRPSSD